MLRKLIRDDLKDMFPHLMPPAVILMVVMILSSVCYNKLSGTFDGAAAALSDAMNALCGACRWMLLFSVLPVALVRSHAVFAGDEAVFWAGVPARPWKKIVSKSAAVFLLFLLTCAMYGIALPTSLLFYSEGYFIKEAYNEIIAAPALFVRDTVLSGAVILFSMLCVMKICIGSALFSLPMRRRRTAMWLTSVAALLTVAGSYVAGYSVICRLSLFSISESSAKLLTYSFGCAFFGVISLVLTVADTLLLSKRAEW